MMMSGRPGINNQSDSLMSDTEIIASKGVREGMTVKKRKGLRQQQMKGDRHVGY